MRTAVAPQDSPVRVLMGASEKQIRRPFITILRKMNSRTIQLAFYKSVPVMAGYIVLGIGFGILMHNAGYGVLWTAAMSIFIYAGSLQYVGVGLLSGGASVLTTALTSFMVNARHLFYSISMVDHYKDAGKYKPYMIFALTDETYSLLCDGEAPEGAEAEGAKPEGANLGGAKPEGANLGGAKPEGAKPEGAKPEGFDLNQYRFFVSLFNQSYWVTGSIAGSLLGAVLPFSTAGIEFSMTALFAASFTEQWITAKDHVPALTGLLGTLLCLVLFGRENFLIPSMLLITLVLTLFRGRISAADRETVTSEERESVVTEDHRSVVTEEQKMVKPYKQGEVAPEDRGREESRV